MAGAGGRGSFLLSKILSEKCKGTPPSKCSPHQLLALVDDMLMVWSREDVCLYATLFHSPQNSVVQTLALSRPPVWEVERVLVNKSESCVALVGRRGVAIVDLPQRSGSPPLFDRGRETIICRVEYVADRFLSCHPKLEVVDVAWHPGSPDNNHLVLLTSDNNLRIYNMSSLEMPEQTVSVGRVQSGVVISSGLGESPIAFAFGMPREALKSTSGNPISNGIFSRLDDDDAERGVMYRALQWPVFLLFGSGDIYYIITTLNSTKPWQHTLEGPLAMTPSSIDNYGVDFCSLLVLPSWPPVLVLATTTGHLHHCVLMSPHTQSLQESMRNLNMSSEGTNTKLYVYESVELELSLLPEDEGFTSSILLHHDPSSPTRYWVSHEAGIHTVTVPLVENFIQFSETSQECEFPEGENECHIEHLVCTRSVASEGRVAVTGVVSGAAHSVVVLLASGKVIVLTLPPALHPRLSRPRTPPPHLQNSPLRKVHTENFENHIRSDLQRCRSQPVLASGSSSVVSAGEYLTMVSRVMATLRTNYLQPQRAATVQIHRRSDILCEQKQRLNVEIEDLQAQKKTLTEKAHELAEKYEEANDKKNQLIERLERVISQVMRALPVLSSSEKNMNQELEDMMTHLPVFTNQLAQIKEKDKWQANQMDKLENNDAFKKHQSCNVSDTQQKALNQALSKESEKLSVLMEKVTQAKLDVHL